MIKKPNLSSLKLWELAKEWNKKFTDCDLHGLSLYGGYTKEFGGVNPQEMIEHLGLLAEYHFSQGRYKLAHNFMESAAKIARFRLDNGVEEIRRMVPRLNRMQFAQEGNYDNAMANLRKPQSWDHKMRIVYGDDRDGNSSSTFRQALTNLEHNKKKYDEEAKAAKNYFQGLYPTHTLAQSTAYEEYVEISWWEKIEDRDLPLVYAISLSKTPRIGTLLPDEEDGAGGTSSDSREILKRWESPLSEK